MSDGVTYSGFWTDEGLANRIPAEVAMANRTLYITLDDGRSFEFPRSLAVLSAPVIGGRRILHIGTNGQVEVDNDKHLDEIFPIQSKSLLSQLERLERRQWIAWAGAILLPITLALGFHFGVPMLARALAETMPQTTNDRLSNEVLTRLERTGKFRSSMIAPSRQREIEYKLKHILGDRPIASAIKLKVYDAGAVATAMALPNGTVILTDELIRVADNDSQILAVLGHEVGHVANRHQVRQAISRTGLTGMVALVTGGAASQLVSASMVGHMANMSYSRSMETEADRYAFKLSRESKINPVAFAQILEKIGDTQNFDPIRTLSARFPKSKGAVQIRFTRNSYIASTDGKEMVIVHDAGDQYYIQDRDSAQVFRLRVGETIRFDDPFPVEITRRRATRNTPKTGYFSSHPATAERTLAARQAGEEFEKTGR